MEYVVLVDESDNEVGRMEKLQAHQNGGRLHRAISVFIFNTQGEMLLQRRAAGKYHSGGLWTNACCSHPRPGEPATEAAERRLFEEMGIKCPLTKIFNFTYKAELDNNLTEHEFDHVFIGITDDKPKPDINEISDCRYVNRNSLEKELSTNPAWFTEWFKICISEWGEQIFCER